MTWPEISVIKYSMNWSNVTRIGVEKFVESPLKVLEFFLPDWATLQYTESIHLKKRLNKSAKILCTLMSIQFIMKIRLDV